MSKIFRCISCAVVALPVIVFAFSTGPEPRLTGAPGDQTCVLCHGGTSLNGGGGNITLTSSAGATYSPGQTQTLTLTINDSAARVYGFQISARLASDLANSQAGDFTAGQQQFVQCSNGSPKGGSGCPANAPLQFIEHSSPSSSNTITVSWTAPSSNAGPVTIYAAANAANGNGNNTGDHIYTTSLQLTAGVSSNKPAIQQGGVVSASAFQPGGIAPGTWIEIYGSNLARATRSWQASDFQGNAAPTSLEGVSVTIGGQRAFVAYISPGQVNVQAPDNIPIGSAVPLVLSNGQEQSEVYTLQTSAVAPALLAPSAFMVDGKQYVAATVPSNDPGTIVFAGPTGAIRGVATRPAVAGEVITFYGIGFGGVSPSVAAGTIATQTTSLNDAVTMLFGQANATILYAGLAPGFVGLYQFNVQVPSNPAGDTALNVRVGGTALTGTKYVATQ